MGVLYTPAARRDIDEIWQFTVTHWGDKAADDYVRAIAHSADRIAATPEIGAKVDAIRAGYRKFPVRSHVIFYRIEDGDILVVRVLHQSRDTQAQVF